MLDLNQSHSWRQTVYFYALSLKRLEDQLNCNNCFNIVYIQAALLFSFLIHNWKLTNLLPENPGHLTYNNEHVLFQLVCMHLISNNNFLQPPGQPVLIHSSSENVLSRLTALIQMHKVANWNTWVWEFGMYKQIFCIKSFNVQPLMDINCPAKLATK